MFVKLAGSLSVWLSTYLNDSVPAAWLGSRLAIYLFDLLVVCLPCCLAVYMCGWQHGLAVWLSICLGVCVATVWLAGRLAVHVSA
jgi:hypothetical protein